MCYCLRLFVIQMFLSPYLVHIPSFIVRGPSMSKLCIGKTPHTRSYCLRLFDCLMNINDGTSVYQ